MSRNKTTADSIIMEDVNIREWFTEKSSRYIQALASKENVRVRTETFLVVDYKKEIPTAEKVIKVTKL